MIKCEMGAVSWSGRKITIQSELCTLIHGLIVRGVFTPEEIDACVADAKKTEDEVSAEIEELESNASPMEVAFARLLAQMLSKE